MNSTTSFPPNEKKFSIDVEGDITRKRYLGEFVCVCMPTLKQKSDIAILQARLNGDLASLDDSTKAYHNMIAQCSIRLISAPDWWMASDNGRNLMDLSIVVEIFSQCLKAQEEWLAKVWSKEEPKDGTKSE
jgi:hypothetical protein